MKRTRRSLALLLIGLVLLAARSTPLAGADKEQADKEKADRREKASVWMAKKLDYTQKVLAGLTRGDFELIKKNAQQLQVVGYLEAWERSEQREYRRYVRIFEDATREIIDQAEKENLNGVTLAYTQLTLSCVQCHTMIRDAKKKK